MRASLQAEVVAEQVKTKTLKLVLAEALVAVARLTTTAHTSEVSLTSMKQLQGMAL